jgi:hypothetical protein
MHELRSKPGEAHDPGILFEIKEQEVLGVA